MHADQGYSVQRRVPQSLLCGPFNAWGFDSGITSKMTQRADNCWEPELMTNWPTTVEVNVFGYNDYFYGDRYGLHIYMSLFVPKTINRQNVGAPSRLRTAL